MGEDVDWLKRKGEERAQAKSAREAAEAEAERARQEEERQRQEAQRAYMAEIVEDYGVIAFERDGSIQLHVNSTAEAKLAIKQPRLKKKELAQFRRFRFFGAFAILAAMLAAGCSETVSDTGYGPAFRAHMQQASAKEKPFFADGVIEFAEYEEAVQATVGCVEERGFTMDVQLAADGFYQYVGVANGRDDALAAALDACRLLWSRQVELAYQESQGPTADELPAVRATMQCLIDAGYPPTGGTRPDQLRAFIDQLPGRSLARACANLLPRS